MTTASTPLPRPTSTQRWTAMVLVSLAMFGNCYLYDTRGLVGESMGSQLGRSCQQIGVFSAATSVAAVLVLLASARVIESGSA